MTYAADEWASDYFLTRAISCVNESSGTVHRGDVRDAVRGSSGCGGQVLVGAQRGGPCHRERRRHAVLVLTPRPDEFRRSKP